eukprot:6456744-Amphidinium_carterae.1
MLTLWSFSCGARFQPLCQERKEWRAKFFKQHLDGVNKGAEILRAMMAWSPQTHRVIYARNQNGHQVEVCQKKCRPQKQSMLTCEKSHIPKPTNSHAMSCIGTRLCGTLGGGVALS